MVYLVRYMTHGSLWSCVIIVQMYDEWLTVTVCFTSTNVWHVAHCELVVCIWTDIYQRAHFDLVVYLERWMTRGSQLTCCGYLDNLWTIIYWYFCNFCWVWHFFYDFFALAIKAVQTTFSVNYLFTFLVWQVTHCKFVFYLYKCLTCGSLWTLGVYFDGCPAHGPPWPCCVLGQRFDAWLTVYLGRCTTHGSIWSCGIPGRYIWNTR